MIDATKVLEMAILREMYISGAMTGGNITFERAKELADKAGYSLPSREEVFRETVEWSPEIVEAMRIREIAPRDTKPYELVEKSEEF